MGMKHYIGDGNILSTNWGVNLRNLMIRGDLNGDFRVDAVDVAILTSNLDDTGVTHSIGDVNGDGVVTLADLDLVYDH
jgi:hypothetical protein